MPARGANPRLLGMRHPKAAWLAVCPASGTLPCPHISINPQHLLQPRHAIHDAPAGVRTRNPESPGERSLAGRQFRTDPSAQADAGLSSGGVCSAAEENKCEPKRPG